MNNIKPKTILEYIDAAPINGRLHLNKIYAILKSVAPDVDEAIKWGHPFFIEPRFLFSFSAHKWHVGFVTTNAAIAPYRDELNGYEVTKMGILKIPYSKELPANLIQAIAQTQVKLVKSRQDTNFW